MQSAVNTMGTVLIADDDPILSGMWQNLLSDAGFDVLTATTGSNALDTLRDKGTIDVMLLDYKMPIMDGAQTLGRMKDQFPSVKTIGVTGVEYSQLPATYREGVQKILVKPFKGSDLIDAISSVITVPEPVQTGTVKRSMNWVRFALCYTLFVITSAGTIVLLRQSVNDLLSSQ
jgi:two-component system response regulator (stage 0 sporulation protein F)